MSLRIVARYTYARAMATAYIPHLRLSFGGILGADVPEIWSNTLRFYVLGTPPSRDLLEEAAAQCVTPLTNWIQAPQSRISGQAHLTWLKLNWIEANGRQRDQETVQYDILTAPSGNDNQFIPPYYQTFAITMRTRTSRGRGHSGRIFPPMVTYQPSVGTPYCTPEAASGMANQFVVLVRALRTAMATVWQDQGTSLPDLAVFSAGQTTPPVRLPLYTLVTGAVVDRTPDVQHRRTNRIERSEGALILLDP